MISDASLAAVLRLLCPNAESSSIDRAVEILANGGLKISRSEWPPVNREVHFFSDANSRHAVAMAEITERRIPRGYIEVRRLDETIR